MQHRGLARCSTELTYRSTPFWPNLRHQSTPGTEKRKLVAGLLGSGSGAAARARGRRASGFCGAGRDPFELLHATRARARCARRHGDGGVERACGRGNGLSSRPCWGSACSWARRPHSSYRSARSTGGSFAPPAFATSKAIFSNRTNRAARIDGGGVGPLAQLLLDVFSMRFVAYGARLVGARRSRTM